MKFKTDIVVVLLSGFVLGSGCQKWKDNRETLTSENHTLAEASFNNVINHLIIAASPGGALLTDSCFTITTSGSGFPKTMTVVFGSNCTDLLGFAIHGSITASLTDSINHENAVMTATPQDLYIKGYKVEGTATVTNRGNNASGHQTYQMKVTDGILTATQAEAGEEFVIHWECDYQYVIIEKNNEAVLLDDLYQITGNASGTNQEGRSYTAEIIEPLKKYADCRWPGSGKTKIAPSDLDERNLNYGECMPSSCCDYEASEEVRWNDPTVRMK